MRKKIYNSKQLNRHSLGFAPAEMYGYIVIGIIFMYAVSFGFVTFKFYQMEQNYNSALRYKIINSESSNLTVFVNKYTKDSDGIILPGDICNGNLLFSNGDLGKPSKPIFDKNNKQIKCEFIK